MIDKKALKENPFFEKFSDAQLCEVQKICRRKKFKKGENIFHSGEDPANLYFVLSGIVSIVQNRVDESLLKGKVITIIKKDMIFGWSSLVPPYMYTLTAECVSDECNVLSIDRKALLEKCEKDHDLGLKVMSNIVATIGSRFDQFREKLITTRGHELIDQW